MPEEIPLTDTNEENREDRPLAPCVTLVYSLEVVKGPRVYIYSWPTLNTDLSVDEEREPNNTVIYERIKGAESIGSTLAV